MVTERSGRVDPIPARLLELGSSLLRHLLASQIRCHPITPRARDGCVRLGSSPCGVFGQGRCQMRADNPSIIGLALVAMAFSAVAILRWGRLAIRPSTPSGSGVDGRWPMAVQARRFAPSAWSGVFGGGPLRCDRRRVPRPVRDAGVGGHIRRWRPRPLTNAEEVVGEITLSGTSSPQGRSRRSSSQNTW